MKVPLPIKILFYFIIFNVIVTVVLELLTDVSLASFLYWALPCSAILYLIFLIVLKSHKKRKNYHGKFSNSSENL
jgi:hypothetical protein